jgi:hypothetical protein
MSVLTTRLSRVIDRARVLEARFAALAVHEQENARAELATLSRRGPTEAAAPSLFAAALLLALAAAAAAVSAVVTTAWWW